MTRPSIKGIEKNINDTILFAWYEGVYGEMRRIELQNEWLKTQAGKDDLGSEIAEERIKQQEAQIKSKVKQLEFITSLILK